MLEWGFIFLPLLYHSLYGFYIWYRGESNVGEYPWTGNWLYTSQRWTGMIAFFYIVYHTYYMRFTGVHLMGGGYNAAFWKVQNEFQNPWAVALYVIGIIAASWHFCLWRVAVRREVGHHRRRPGAQAIRLRLRAACRRRSCSSALRMLVTPSYAPVPSGIRYSANRSRSNPADATSDRPRRLTIKCCEPALPRPEIENCDRFIMANPKIIIVGGGLAGLSAAIKVAEMGGQVDLFSIVPVKRSHSVCAQGGINAAKNLKGEGDSTWQHFDDTVYGGDFLANQPPVKYDVRNGPGDHRPARPHGRSLQPHSRRPARFPPLRRHALQPHRLCRSHHRPAAALRARRAGAPLRSPKARSASTSTGSSSPPCSTRRTTSAAASAPWTCARWRCVTFPADAVIIATGGIGAIFGKSTNSVVCTGSAQSALYQQGASYGNGEMIQVHPTCIPGEDKLRLMSESARGEGGRVWVPRQSGRQARLQEHS